MALAPDFATGYRARAYVRIYIWDWQGARSDLDRALVLGPGSADVDFVLSIYLASQGRLQEAIAVAKRRIDREPLNAGAWSTLGNFHEAAGQFALAEQALERALSISPDSDYPLSNMAVALLRPPSRNLAPEAMAKPEGPFTGSQEWDGEEVGVLALESEPVDPAA